MESGPGERHFCIFDELYSGTNPYEAVASSYSFLDYLTKQRKHHVHADDATLLTFAKNSRKTLASGTAT